MSPMMPYERRVALGVGSSLFAGAFTALGLAVLIWARSSGFLVVLFLVPILVAASWPAFVRQARRERLPSVANLLLLALALKLLGAVIRHWVAFSLYGGVADAAMYHEYGTRLARRFWAGDLSTGLETLIGTDFIRFFTGLVYTITGPSIYAGFLLYAWLAFWGTYFLYRAFVIAVPDGNKRSYARLLFFLPSMLYWPSSIGKEAWMMLALGLTAYGTARLLTGRTWRGLAVAGTGLWLCALVRPHVAGMVGFAMLVAYLLARPPDRLGAMGPVMKVFALGVLVAAAILLLGQTRSYLQDKGIDPEEGVSSVLAASTERTTQGGSNFEAPSAITSPVRFPISTVTILFRPFLFEAHNLQAAVTALESTLLLCLTMSRRSAIWRAVRGVRSRPYVTFVLLYGALFVFAFSSIGNFGILARERTQLLPFFLVLLAVPGARVVRRAGMRAAPALQEGRGDAARQPARA